MDPPLIENVQPRLLWDVRPVTVSAVTGLLVREARALELEISTILVDVTGGSLVRGFVAS